MARKQVTNRSADGLPVTTSVPPKLPSEQEAFFRGVLSLLRDERVPFAVSGGFALQRHTGISRFTKDLDLFLTAPNASRALRLLAGSDFYCEVCDPVWLAKAHRDGYFIDLITGMSNGALAVDASWIARSRPASIVGIETRVLAPEELIASKLFVVRRERYDGSDIAHVIYALRGNLQWDRILQLAGDHWELVLWNLVLFRYVYPQQTHYVPRALWDDLLSRYAAEIRRRGTARFRGSLIDDKMFAIDVDEWGLEDVARKCQASRVKIRAMRSPGRASKRRRPASGKAA